MARTKQTAYGSSAMASRPVGMEQAMLLPVDQPEQQGEQEEVEITGEGNIPKPQQAAPSKDPPAKDPTENPTDPTDPSKGVQGDAEANLETATQGLQANTSTSDPSTSTSTGADEPTDKVYTSKWQEYTKTWLEEVPEKQEVAYKSLIEKLLALVQGQGKDLKVGVDDLGDDDIESIIYSIPDTSGKYIKMIGKFQFSVTKEEEETSRKRLMKVKKDDKVQRAMTEYFDAAKISLQPATYLHGKSESIAGSDRGNQSISCYY